MYRKINPFSEDELRQHCGKAGPDGKKLFPDESNGDDKAKEGKVKIEAVGGGGGGGATS
jgi:hypothetical protein